MSRNHNQRNFMFGAMLGSTLGALTAMMFTTKKGKKIQGEMLDKFDEWEEIAKSYTQGKKQKAKRALNKLAKTMDKRISTAKRKVKRKIKRRIPK